MLPHPVQNHPWLTGYYNRDEYGVLRVTITGAYRDNASARDIAREQAEKFPNRIYVILKATSLYSMEQVPQPPPTELVCKEIPNNP